MLAEDPKPGTPQHETLSRSLLMPRTVNDFRDRLKPGLQQRPRLSEAGVPASAGPRASDRSPVTGRRIEPPRRNPGRDCKRRHLKAEPRVGKQCRDESGRTI